MILVSKSKRIYSFLLIYSLLIVLSSCRKKEGTDWDTHWLGPLFRTSLTIQQIVPDTLMATDPNNVVHLYYDKVFKGTGFISTQQLPDTAILKYFTIPFGTVTLNPGDNFLDLTEESVMNFGALELSRLIVKTGIIDVKIVNKINKPVDVTYILPKSQKNGQPYTFNATIPAYTTANGGLYEASFAIEGYDFDLRGISGAYVNRLVTHLIANISTSAVGQAQINAADSLLVSLKLKNIVPYYAKGYFGHSLDTSSTSTNLNFFDRIIAGGFSLQEAKLNLDIKNGIGADLRANLLNFQSVNSQNGTVVSLQHSSVGQTINVHRATDNPFSPSQYSFEFNSSNSNLVHLLENMPNRFDYSYATELNPFGNIANGNDFVYPDKAIEARLTLDIPLHLSTNNLTLVDTIYLNKDSIKPHNSIQSAALKLIALNTFPFDAEVQFYLLDENLQKQEQLLSESRIKAATPDSDGKVRTAQESRLPANINHELLNKLLEKRKVLAVVTLNTINNPMKYKIYSDYKIDLKLTGNMLFNLQIK